MKLSHPTAEKVRSGEEPRQEILHAWLCQSRTHSEIDNSFTFLTARAILGQDSFHHLLLNN